MHSPLISIIIPVFNREELILKTLVSIQNQIYSNWECIIVDDSSTDNSYEVVKKHIKDENRFRIFKRPSDIKQGGNAARNYGYEKSKGDYVIWFDSDDLMTNDFLSLFEKNLQPNINLLINSGKYIDVNDLVIGDFKYDDNDFLYKRYAMYKSIIITGNVLFRKKYLDSQLVLFDESIYRLQENEFFTRIFYKTRETEYVHLKNTSFLYRQHDNSITSKDKKYHSKFKKSLIDNYSSNLNRSILLKDIELICYYQRLIINLFYDMFTNKDFRNMKLLLLELFKNGVWKNIHIFKRFVAMSLITLLRRDFYFLRKKLKTSSKTY